jgi:voltage-gated potassium channel
VARSRRDTEFSYGVALALVMASMVMFLMWGDHELVSVTAILLQLLALVAVYHTASLSPGGRRIGGTAAAILAVLLYGTLLGSPEVVRIGAGLVGAGITAILAVNLLRAIAVQPVVDARTILGAITVYLVIGLFFAELFWAVDVFSQGLFFVQGEETDMPDFTYFSYVTMTTVGYGDFNPLTPLARTLAVALAMFGQLYLVTVLAVIVSNLGKEKVGTEDEGLVAVLIPPTKDDPDSTA